MATSASIDKVQKLFIAFYQRPADVTGLEYWANRVDAANGDTSAVVNAFATSAEATALYPATLSTTQLVNNVYQALFGRAPDAAGLNFYANAIAAGTMTPGKLAQNILDGATGTDATIIANKLTVAKAYTAAMDTTAEILAYNGNNGNNALANAKALLTNVNALDTSVTNATNQIPAIMVNNVNNAAATITAPGTAFTFTSGLDNYVGTANADIVSGAVADIAATDTVQGAAGAQDQLTLTTAGALSFVTAAGVNGFEKLVLANGTNTITLDGATQDSVGATASVTGDATGAAPTNNFLHTITGGTGYDTLVLAADSTVNMTTVTGIEQYNIVDDGAGGTAVDLTFTGAATTATILGLDTGATSSVITLGNFTNSITIAGAAAKSIVGGTGTDTVTALSTQSGSAVTINAVENYNGSSAAADTVTLAAGSTTTVNFANVEIVNAGTGAQTLNFGGSATGVTYNNGLLTSGADTINLNAANAAADTISYADGAGTFLAVTVTAPAAGVIGSIAANSVATVNGFVAANDKIGLDVNGSTGGAAATNTGVVQAVATAAATTLSAISNVTAFNFDAGAAVNVLGGVSNGAALIANIGAFTVANNQKGHIVAYDAGNAYLYAFNNAGDGTANGATDTTLQAGEIVLIGTFNSVAVGALSGTNFSVLA